MEPFKRRIRIVGNAGELRGYMLTVRDADTDERIPNVKAITVCINATGNNTADVTYYGEVDAEKTVTTHNPIIDITAYELAPNLNIDISERL